MTSSPTTSSRSSHLRPHLSLVTNCCGGFPAPEPRRPNRAERRRAERRRAGVSPEFLEGYEAGLAGATVLGGPTDDTAEWWAGLRLGRRHRIHRIVEEAA